MTSIINSFIGGLKLITLLCVTIANSYETSICYEVNMIIYKTTNLANGMIYVGKDKHNNPNYIGSGKILKRAIKKNGKGNFKKEILEHVTDENWHERERYWIKKLDSRNRDIGYNILEGGRGGASSGEQNGMYGKTHSPETMKIIKAKASAWSQKNKHKCAFNKGRKFPQSVRDNMSKARMGSKNPASKRIKVFGKIYETIVAAHLDTGYSKWKIRKNIVVL